MKAVAMNVNFQMKLTLLNLEFYNFIYEPKIG